MNNWLPVQAWTMQSFSILHSVYYLSPACTVLQLDSLGPGIDTTNLLASDSRTVVKGGTCLNSEIKQALFEIILYYCFQNHSIFVMSIPVLLKFCCENTSEFCSTLQGVTQLLLRNCLWFIHLVTFPGLFWQNFCSWDYFDKT